MTEVPKIESTPALEDWFAVDFKVTMYRPGITSPASGGVGVIVSTASREIFSSRLIFSTRGSEPSASAWAAVKEALKPVRTLVKR